MKLVSKLLLAIGLLAVVPFAYAQPVYLYDTTGNVAAVVDPDNQSYIYLASSGEPVGYIDTTNGAVYSFAGKHLGWYSDGVLWDNNGYMLAFVDSNKPKTLDVELVKKEVVLKPTKPVIVTTTKEVVTTPPVYVYEVSPTPLNQVFTISPAQ